MQLIEMVRAYEHALARGMKPRGLVLSGKDLKKVIDREMGPQPETGFLQRLLFRDLPVTCNPDVPEGKVWVLCSEA